ncbi:MAG TPA: metallophosphoesterase [bacterium]|nr:metallophosphoesterase [bacterium]
MRFIRKLLLFLLLMAACSDRADIGFQFAWLSDTHVGTATGTEDLRRAVADINNLSEIHFVVLSGDITELGSNAELDTAKTILDELKAPYFIIPGNHDTKWSESGCTYFSTLWGSDKFSCEYQNIRFIGMHQGPVMRMGDGHFAPEDIRWLDIQLRNTDSKQPIIFVTHYPLNNTITNWFEVLDRLKQHNVQVVLFGHGHRNRIYDLEGITGLMGRSSLRRNQASGGYNIVRVSSDSLHFFERITMQETNDAWFKTAIEQRDYLSDTTHYERPSFIENEKYEDVQVRWMFDTDYTIAASPAVWEDYVVAGNSNGDIYCLYVEDGTIIWKFKAGKGVFSPPEIAEQRVVFGANDGYVYCLNVVDGKLVWRFKTNAPVVAAPKVYDNTVFIGASDGSFRAIDLADGDLIWEFSGLQSFVEAKPLIHHGKVIFGAWDTFLYALDIEDGSLVWKWSNGHPGKLFSPAVCTPVASSDRVYIVAPDRFMTALNAANGETIWRSNRFKVRESIGISDDKKTIFVKCMQDTLVAISTLSSAPLANWISNCGFGYDINPSVPVEKEGILYFSTQRGYVYSVDAATGKLLWKYRISHNLVHTLALANTNQLIAADMGGRIFNVQAGEMLD